jgi:putative transposase
MIKAFKFQLLPTKEQEVLLAKHFGCKRFVWNYFLNRRKEEYLKDKKTLNYYECASELVNLKKQEETSWLKEINSQTLQSTLRDLDGAYNRFFRKQSKFPKFKSKWDRQSFRVPQHISVKNNKIFFPKFNEGIKINIHREINGEICFIAVSKTPTGKYFVSITCEVGEIPKLPISNKSIGVDLGIKDFAVCSNGEKFDNPKHYQKLEKKLKFRQRQLSKKQKGSKSRDKQRKQVARIHEKITNSRQDFLHKLSTKLIHENQVICIEDLDVKGMMADRNVAKSIGTCGWGEFVRQLNYKAEWYGREIIKVDRFFPSSKTCNHCGWINEGLTLSDREWTCCCGKVIDRDLNAALNILQQGVNLKKSGLGIKSDSKQKQVEASTLVESTKPEIQHL